ncbi:transcriptional regulator [Siccirubricoccus deserti]|uniref:PLP-dependent aminotransferase family protein n=1 Tax=Siccirubricoccus deserti TaxID=2013562 RepID=A0A9X0UC43_9PROT|nr:PLP-dependent aminotransferase family protein [Siccirubricoccus deserti]MBC4014769.1 PLP-dependent aminotransferase family protein [Siccirubricoccus deserti]GGC34810.1 transcriptional regulator [Siccirubricoccus deserti]
MKPSPQGQGWIPRIAGASGPIYLAIADAIGAAITAGVLRPGERLPTHRALADALGVDLTTITRAYAEARRRGLLQATVGRGTFVRGGQAPAPQPRPEESGGPVDLGMNMPPQPTDPPLRDLLQRGMSALLARADAAAILTYRTGAAAPEERAAGAAWLRPTLGEVEPARVLVCPGAQPALLAVLGTLVARGDVVLTDAFTYPGIRTATAQLGIRLAGVAADAEGMSPDAVEAACRATGAKALYCIPTIQNPTTVTMPLARRRAIAEVARRHGLRIVEDDAYGLLPAAPLPAIASLAPDLTFHIATMSKVLTPALRVAYLVAPDAGCAVRLSGALRANVLMASPLLTGLMTAWVQDGTAGAVLAAIRRECAARQRIAREILPRGSFEAHPEGLHLWLHLPARWDRLHFAAHLRRRGGLAVVPSDAFAVGTAMAGAPAGKVRVSLGAASGQEGLRTALRLVAEALREETPTPFSEVV